MTVRIHLDAGEQLDAQLLIPDLAPESDLNRWQLPWPAIVDPYGRVQVLRHDQRESFREEFTDTNYLVLTETTRAARTGTYALIVAGAAPSRFVAVSGSGEQFTADIRNARIGTATDVLNRYNTPVSPGTRRPYGCQLTPAGQRAIADARPAEAPSCAARAVPRSWPDTGSGVRP